jgi:hypothetical protein
MFGTTQRRSMTTTGRFRSGRLFPALCYHTYRPWTSDGTGGARALRGGSSRQGRPFRRQRQRWQHKLRRAICGEELKNSHQFRQLLTVLRENNQIMLTAGNRIAKIVWSLQNFARLDEAELKEADLHDGLESTLSLLHHEIQKGAAVLREYRKIPSVRCYPSHLNQDVHESLHQCRAGNRERWSGPDQDLFGWSLCLRENHGHRQGNPLAEPIEDF